MMNNDFLRLSTENFYAETSTMRNFFMMGMSDPKSFTLEEEPVVTNIISNYGEEYNTIYITGMMLREQSWITDLGWATSTEQVIEGIQSTLAEGKKVKLIINSGGGLVTGTSNLADIIYENRENIEAYATAQVASSAMWVFSSAGKRYAEDTTILGSIGVVRSVFDDEAYYKSHGIIWKEVTSENAPNKRPDVKTESGMKEIERYLTSLESVFIESVSKNLDMTKEDVVSKFHRGGLITGLEALDMDVISSLTSYNMGATMPLGSNSSTDKMENLKSEGNQMITQKEFDDVQGKLDIALTANATLTTEKSVLDKDLLTANGTITTLTGDLDKAQATIAVTGELVAMAFEHSVKKDVAIQMVATGDKGESAIIALGSKPSNGSTTDNTDLPVDGDEVAKTEAEDAEMAYARELAEKYSVNKK